jgi:hypothetical protein
MRLFPAAPSRCAPRGRYENIRLAVGQLAGRFSVVCLYASAVALAGLLARTVRYLWNAIRGFIGIGCIYAIPPLV